MTQDHFKQGGEQRDDIEETSPPTQKANSATTDVVKLDIIKLLKEMREDNKTFKKKNKNNLNEKTTTTITKRMQITTTTTSKTITTTTKKQQSE